MIDQIMEYNKKFVENKGYEPFLTSKYPDKKLAILTCMDTRLIELLPAALGIKNGDGGAGFVQHGKGHARSVARAHHVGRKALHHRVAIRPRRAHGAGNAGKRTCDEKA